MSDKKVFCNVSECFFNVALEEVHLKKGRPGFTPLPGTDEYRGECSLDRIKVAFRRFRSSTNMAEKVPFCASYTEEEPKEVDVPEMVLCEHTKCLFNESVRGEVGVCRKFEQDEQSLYIDWKDVFVNSEKIRLPVCKSASDKNVGHIDFAKAAQGNRGGDARGFPKVRPEDYRPKIGWGYEL